MFLTSKGELTLRFKDGHEFDIGLSENKITNVFWGDMSEFLLISAFFYISFFFF
jgi:hypothetical protein